MGQVSLRANDALIDRVKDAAAAQGVSMNEFIAAVLDAATDPDLAGDEAEGIRQRLRSAGLLAPASEAAVHRPDPDRLAKARASAGQGTPLADLVRADRA